MFIPLSKNRHLPINNEQHSILGRLVPEGNIVGNHDGRIEGQYEYYPIPNGLESTIVQQNVWRRLGRLLSVLRQNLWIECHKLIGPFVRTVGSRKSTVELIGSIINQYCWHIRHTMDVLKVDAL